VVEVANIQLPTSPITGSECNSAKTYAVSGVNEKDGEHCIASTDSNLEAFSRNPSENSFAALAFQLATFTKYLIELFLSY